MKKNLRKNMDSYNYNKPGCAEMGYRVPDNLFGKTLRSTLKATMDVNK